VHNHAILAMIHGQLGRQEEARAAARQVLKLDPEFEQNAWYELRLRNFPAPMAEHMADGLRKAGLQIAPAPEERTIRAADSADGEVPAPH
jgi:Tetratricopeptide repeat